MPISELEEAIREVFPLPTQGTFDDILEVVVKYQVLWKVIEKEGKEGAINDAFRDNPDLTEEQLLTLVGLDKEGLEELVAREMEGVPQKLATESLEEALRKKFWNDSDSAGLLNLTETQARARFLSVIVPNITKDIDTLY
jgi:hypothetical protein